MTPRRTAPIDVQARIIMIRPHSNGALDKRAVTTSQAHRIRSRVLHPLVKGLANWLGESHHPTTTGDEASAQQSGRVIAVGSGKGGVGKTLVSSSIALRLAEHSGQRVVAIDVDLGGANLHTGLGIRRPSFALNRFILEKAPLRELSWHLQQLRFDSPEFLQLPAVPVIFPALLGS